MPKKQIVVINGKGGAGKDTLCDSLRDRYRVMNVSAIDPIKEIARQHGWQGEKDDKARRFLAELKQAFIHYNDLPTEYLKDKTREFCGNSDELLFVHIREADQIEHYRQAIRPLRCVTLLVRRAAADSGRQYGNAADDEVENFDYDLVFQNDRPIGESAEAFRALIESIS